MPIYEYECTSCHHHFDLMQKINEAPATTCPNCSENKLVKLVSAAGFQLKGTGWYATDFKNKNSKPDTAKTTAGSGSDSTNKNNTATTTSKTDAE